MKFYKYSATGNDFIIFDHRHGELKNYSPEWGQSLCARSLGVGADGILLLEPSKAYDFKMRYFNSDGKEAEMCGNGARAISHFAHTVVALKAQADYEFETLSGVFRTYVNGDQVQITMTQFNDINTVNLDFLNSYERQFYIDTGVPHVVLQVDAIDKINVEQEGRKIRMNPAFQKGANVNFFEDKGEGRLVLRTYERGVERETLACGTGVTATAYAQQTWQGNQKLKIQAQGGEYEVLPFDATKNEMIMQSKVKLVYTGELASPVEF